MVKGPEAWFMLAWGIFVPGLAIAVFIYYNIKYRNRK